MRLSILLIFFVAFFAVSSQAQYLPQAPAEWNPYRPESPALKLRKRNYGAILGFQRGRYDFIEFGAEHHWRTIQLKRPRIYGASANAAYNIRHNVLGYNAAFWLKEGRVNLTYGLNAAYYTDFTHSRYGGGPVVGFRLLGFHLQTGYNYLAGDKAPETGLAEVNSLYISLRYYFPVSNDFTWDRGKKNNDRDDKDKERRKKKKEKERKKKKKEKAKAKQRKGKDRKDEEEDTFKQKIKSIFGKKD